MKGPANIQLETYYKIKPISFFLINHFIFKYIYKQLFIFK